MNSLILLVSRFLNISNTNKSPDSSNFPSNDKEILEQLMLKANKFQKSQNNQEALKLYEEALLIAEKIHGKNSFYVATIINMKATIILSDFENINTAMTILENNKKIYEDLITENNHKEIEERNKIGYLTCISVLGNCNYLNNKSEKALSLYQEYCERSQKFNITLPDLESEVFYLMGAIYFKKEKFTDAINFFDKSVKILEKIFGENNFHYISYLKSLGEAYMKNKEYQRAYCVFDKVIKISLKLEGPQKIELLNECTEYLNLIQFEISQNRRS